MFDMRNPGHNIRTKEHSSVANDDLRVGPTNKRVVAAQEIEMALSSRPRIPKEDTCPRIDLASP
jgi:hypothetical protein